MAEPTIHRGILQRVARDLIKHGTHMEYDWPGDAPEPCGQWCDICNQHIDDVDHSKGHKADCSIEILRAILQPDRPTPVTDPTDGGGNGT
jgi:hypothetical protein